MSIRNFDRESGAVSFYAPVLAGGEYRFAKSIQDPPAGIKSMVPSGKRLSIGCNCILNDLHGQMKGQIVPRLAMPMTFGEAAYQLVNQTMVFVEICDAA